jgi:LmbE family N-acetylglucosaminyl deacetylase
MRILAIGAHPDDIEFGCGGTLVKYARQGHQVFLLVMTDGGGGGSVELRRREQEAAAVVLGASKVFWGGYPDTALPLDRDLIQHLEQVIGEVEPDFIFVHYHDDTHQDHRTVITLKVASLEAHGSQVSKTNIEGLSIVDIARSSAHFRGIQGRVKNAEGFTPLRLFINIAP